MRATFEGQHQIDAGFRGRITAVAAGIKVTGIAQAGVRGVVSVGGDLNCSGATCLLAVGAQFKGGGFVEYSLNADLWGIWSAAYADTASYMLDSGRIGLHWKFPNPI